MPGSQGSGGQGWLAAGVGVGGSGGGGVEEEKHRDTASLELGCQPSLHAEVGAALFWEEQENATAPNSQDGVFAQTWPHQQVYSKTNILSLNLQEAPFLWTHAQPRVQSH